MSSTSPKRTTSRRLGPSLGWQVVHWCETFLCHGPGDLRGEPFVTDGEMLRFFAACYELDRSGARRVDEAMLSRAKGRAKSEEAGKLVCAEFLGPVRFDHWAERGETSWWGYEYETGEPVGRPIRDPLIRCLATEESQAGNTYDNVEVMLNHLVEHHGDDFPTIDVGRTRVFNTDDGGEIRPSTASSASKDGGKETFVVADETHLYLLPELHDMYDTVSRNLTKRPAAEPWLLNTSTMFQPGKDSEAERLHKRAKRGDDPRLLLDHLAAAMPVDWDDDVQLLGALKAAAGDAAEWMDFTRRLRECRRTSKAKASRYFLNRAEVDEVQAVDPDRWAALAVPGPPAAQGAAVTVGFDGSESGDSTGLIGVDMVSGRWFVVGLWESAGRPDGWRVPRGEVDAVVEATFGHFTVVRMYCDPKGWRSEIADWQARWTDKVVLEYPTNSWRRFGQAVDAFLTGIAEGSLSHDGDPDLAQHVANARTVEINPRRPQDGVVLVKESPNSPLKIDLAVAGCLAGRARLDAMSDGWKPAQRPRVVDLAAALARSEAGGG